MSEESRKNQDKRLKNLKPQKAGEPGHNPNGRPKGSKNIKTSIDRIFNLVANDTLKMEYMDIDPEIKDNFDLFNAAIMAHAIKGDSASKNIILDRYFGKVSDKTELSGNVDVNLDPAILAVAKILNERKRNKE